MKWLKRICLVAILILTWEGVRYVVGEIRVAIRGTCQPGYTILSEGLNCEEYRNRTEAIESLGFDWTPGYRGSICVSPEQEEAVFQKLAEMNLIQPVENPRCPLP